MLCNQCLEECDLCLKESNVLLINNLGFCDGKHKVIQDVFLLNEYMLNGLWLIKAHILLYFSSKCLFSARFTSTSKAFVK